MYICPLSIAMTLYTQHTNIVQRIQLIINQNDVGYIIDENENNGIVNLNVSKTNRGILGKLFCITTDTTSKFLIIANQYLR